MFPIVPTVNVLKDLAAGVVANALLVIVWYPIRWVAALATAGRPSPNPKFCGKTWISKDGESRLVCNSIRDITLLGRLEGPLVIEIDYQAAASPNHFEGRILCDDHGGSVSRISLDLEPFNQIHLRTTSSVIGNYSIDEIFRIAWPEDSD